MHFRTFLQFRHEVIDYLVEGGHVAALQILHLQVDGVTVTISRDLRHLERDDLCILDVLATEIEFVHHHVDIVLNTFAVIPWFETHDERTVTNARTGDKSETGHLGVTLHFLEPQHMFLYLRHDLIGFNEWRTGRCCHIDQNNALVFLRHESRRQCAH